MKTIVLLVCLLLAASVQAQITTVWALDGETKIAATDTAHPSKSYPYSLQWNGTSVWQFGSRNEIVAFQLMLQAGAEGANNVRVTMDTLKSTELGGPSLINTNSGPYDLEGQYIRWFVERYITHPTRTQSGAVWWGGARPLPDAAYNNQPIPEQLIPQESWRGEDTDCEGVSSDLIVQPYRLQGFQCRIYIPQDLPRGTYTGTIRVYETLKDDKDEDVDSLVKVVACSLKVFGGTLSDTTFAPFDYQYMGPSIITQHPNTTQFSAEFWRLVKNYKLWGKRHRINLVVGGMDTSTVKSQYASLYFAGDAYKSGSGYEGPGEGLGDQFYPVGIYGSFAGLYRWNAGYSSGGANVPSGSIQRGVIYVHTYGDNGLVYNGRNIGGSTSREGGNTDSAHRYTFLGVQGVTGYTIRPGAPATGKVYRATDSTTMVKWRDFWLRQETTYPGTKFYFYSVDEPPRAMYPADSASIKWMKPLKAYANPVTGLDSMFVPYMASGDIMAPSAQAGYIDGRTKVQIGLTMSKVPYWESAFGVKVGDYNGNRPTTGTLSVIDAPGTDPIAFILTHWRYRNYLKHAFNWETGYLFDSGWEGTGDSLNPWDFPRTKPGEGSLGAGTTLWPGRDAYNSTTFGDVYDYGLDGPIDGMRWWSLSRGIQNYQYYHQAQRIGFDADSLIKAVIPYGLNDPYNHADPDWNQSQQPRYSENNQRYESQRLLLATTLELEPGVVPKTRYLSGWRIIP